MNLRGRGDDAAFHGAAAQEGTLRAQTRRIGASSQSKLLAGQGAISLPVEAAGIASSTITGRLVPRTESRSVSSLGRSRWPSN